MIGSIMNNTKDHDQPVIAKPWFTFPPVFPDVGVGTDEDPDKSDVFPNRQVGYNSSGTVKITGDGISMGNDTGAVGNLSDALNKPPSRQRRSTGSSQFYMEPGRCPISACCNIFIFLYLN